MMYVIPDIRNIPATTGPIMRDNDMKAKTLLIAVPTKSILGMICVTTAHICPTKIPSHIPKRTEKTRKCQYSLANPINMKYVYEN